MQKYKKIVGMFLIHSAIYCFDHFEDQLLFLAVLLYCKKLFDPFFNNKKVFVQKC